VPSVFNADVRVWCDPESQSVRELIECAEKKNGEVRLKMYNAGTYFHAHLEDVGLEEIMNVYRAKHELYLGLAGRIDIDRISWSAVNFGKDSRGEFTVKDGITVKYSSTLDIEPSYLADLRKAVRGRNVQLTVIITTD